MLIKFMYENLFVFFGCEDILHRVLFLKNKLLIGIWMYVLCILLNFILFVQETHNVYIYNMCFLKNCMPVTSIASYIDVFRC